MVVHPSAGHYTGTLVNALMYHCKDHLSAINGILRPGIVHRIDMDTTGVIVACKNDAAHISISEQLKEHSITRYYYAICYNPFKVTEGTVDAPIGRHPSDRKKRAINFKTESLPLHITKFSRISANTHIYNVSSRQEEHIRYVYIWQAYLIRYSVILCIVMQMSFNLQGQTLHAGVLGFIHPRTGNMLNSVHLCRIISRIY